MRTWRENLRKNRLLVVAMVAHFLGCASHRITSATGRELVEIDEAWAAAESACDIERFKALLAENAVFYPQGHEPLYGSKAILDYVEKRWSSPGIQDTWTPSCAGINDGGTFAYTTGKYTSWDLDDVGGIRMGHGRYISVWQYVEGSWRCAAKCWNSSPPDGEPSH